MVVDVEQKEQKIQALLHYSHTPSRFLEGAKMNIQEVENV